MNSGTEVPAVSEGQRWFLPGNPRKPARTIIEVSAATGYVDYADIRGERRLCLGSSFVGWARRFGAVAR